MISPLGFSVHSRDADHAGPAGPVFAVLPQGESGGLVCEAPVGELDVCAKPATHFSHAWQPRCAAHRSERAPAL